MCVTCATQVTQSTSLAPVLFTSVSAAAATAVTEVRRRLSPGNRGGEPPSEDTAHLEPADT